jgi:hypothetical protein
MDALQRTALAVCVWTAAVGPTSASDGAWIAVIPDATASEVHGRIEFPFSKEAHAMLLAKGQSRAPSLLAQSLRPRAAQGPGRVLDPWFEQHHAEFTLQGDEHAIVAEFRGAPGDLDALLEHVVNALGSPILPDDVVRARALEAPVDARFAVADRRRICAALGIADRCAEPETAASRPSADEWAGALNELARKHLTRDNAWVAVLGPLDAGPARKSIEGALAKLGPGVAVTPVDERAKDATIPPLAILDLAGRPATELRARLRRSSDTFGDDGYAAMRLAAELAARSSVFDPAWVWSVVPSLDGLPLYLYASASGDALSQTLAALDRLGEALTSATPVELDAARADVLRAERLRSSAPSTRLGAAIGAAQGRWPADAWPQYLARLESATLAQVQIAAPSEPEVCVAVGPAAALRESLGDRAASVVVLPARERTATTTAGETLCERMFAALGGRERWRDLEGLATQNVAHVEGVDLQVSVELWADFRGSRFCVVQTTGAQSVIYVITPSSGFVRTETTTSDLPEEQVRTLRARQERSLYSVVRELARDERFAADAGADGRILVSCDGAPWCWIELDAEGRPAKLGYDEAGVPASTYEYSAWTEAKGFPYAGRTLQVERATELRASSFEANPTFEEGLFERGG